MNNSDLPVQYQCLGYIPVYFPGHVKLFQKLLNWMERKLRAR